MFNSLKYVKILESSGLPRNQAETHIQILGDLIGEEMATKEDLKTEISGLRLEMRSEFKAVRAEMTSEFMAVRAEMASEFKTVRSEMTNLEHRLVIKLGGLMAAFMTVAVTATQILS